MKIVNGKTIELTKDEVETLGRANVILQRINEILEKDDDYSVEVGVDGLSELHLLSMSAELWKELYY